MQCVLHPHALGRAGQASVHPVYGDTRGHLTSWAGAPARCLPAAARCLPGACAGSVPGRPLGGCAGGVPGAPTRACPRCVVRLAVVQGARPGRLPAPAHAAWCVAGACAGSVPDACSAVVQGRARVPARRLGGGAYPATSVIAPGSCRYRARLPPAGRRRRRRHRRAPRPGAQTRPGRSVAACPQDGRADRGTRLGVARELRLSAIGEELPAVVGEEEPGPPATEAGTHMS